MSRTVLIANPSLDVYGADLQMLESVKGMRDAGWRVVVASSDARAAGRAADRARRRDAGACRTRCCGAPTAASADCSGWECRPSPRSRACVAWCARWAPDVCYVNTVTLPWWLVAGRRRGVPVVCHVHEAEPDVRRAVRHRDGLSPAARLRGARQQPDVARHPVHQSAAPARAEPPGLQRRAGTRHRARAAGPGPTGSHRLDRPALAAQGARPRSRGHRPPGRTGVRRASRAVRDRRAGAGGLPRRAWSAGPTDPTCAGG